MAEGPIHFLNLEYFFYSVYRLFSDAEVPELTARFGEWVNTLELLGLLIMGAILATV